MSASVYIGHHDDGTIIRPFYTGLKTKAAAKRAASMRFGEGEVELRPCDVADREIEIRILWFSLRTGCAGKEVAEPAYIIPRRNEKHDTMRDKEIRACMEEYGIGQEEAYDILYAGGDFPRVETDAEGLYADIPF